MTLQIAASCPEEIILHRLKSRLGDLRMFLGALESSVFDPQNDDLFAQTVNEALNRFGIKSAEFSKEFGVHASTAGRWSKGKNFPHKMVRPIVIAWLRERLVVDESRLGEQIQEAERHLAQSASVAT